MTVDRAGQEDLVEHSALPFLAHVIDAALRRSGIWVEVTSMFHEAIDDGSPVS